MFEKTVPEKVGIRSKVLTRDEVVTILKNSL